MTFIPLRLVLITSNISDMKHTRYAFLSFTLLLVVLLPYPAVAQSGLQVQRDEITLNFPTEITFHLEASAPGMQDRLFLLYGTNGRSCFGGSGRQEVEINPATTVEAEWTWDLNRAGSIPSGARLWWQWELVAQDGSKLLTPRQEVEYQDPNYDWNVLSSGDATVQWAAGDQVFGQFMLNLALDSLNRLEENTSARPPSGVRLVLYPDSDALQAVALHSPEWTGGIAYGEYGVTMIGIGPELKFWAEEVVPHELAHLVVNELTFNCYGAGLPTWLNEGLAVMNEGQASSNSLDGVLAALRKGTLPTLRLLSAGFPADPAAAGLAYDQGGAVVRFMSETYGPEKIAALLQEVAAGKTIDQALVAVYGLNTDQLEQAWRGSLGFSFDVPPTPTISAEKPTALPTLALPTISFGSRATATPEITDTPLPPTPAPPTLPPTEPATPLAQVQPTCDPQATSPGCAAGQQAAEILPTAAEGMDEVRPGAPELPASLILLLGLVVLLVLAAGVIVLRSRK